MANSQNLEDMKLPELKELAKQMGLRGTSTMRKPELLATLQAARSGGEPPAGVTVRTPKADKAVTKAAKAGPVVEETAALAEPQLDLSALAEEPKAAEPRRVRRKAADEATEEPRDARHRRDDERTGRKPRQQADEAGDLLASLDLGETTAPERRRNRRDDTEAPLIRRVHDEDQPRRRRRPADSSDETVRDLDDILATLPTQKHDEPSDDGEQSEDREFSRRSRNRDRDRDNRNDRNDRRNRRMRGRDRGENAGEDDRRFDDRENRNDRREEPQEDLVPVAGIVDVLDSYAFVRTSGYLPGPNDVYVSMGQVKK